ncbi:hypothetical protein [Natronomonas gomsonensis]|uniref:hypothetical protein n=1 Tax=Natronomonas gomsonensis TaxID=1046043 RepID=UPI0015B8A557|nr:hypothetical protein [Natronomonas gomsonensis]
MVELPDSVYDDIGEDAPDDDGGSSGGGGGGSTSTDSSGGTVSITSDSDDAPAPGSDEFDEQAQDIVTDNMADQGFVADEDLTSGSGGAATRSPDEGTDFTELGEDVSDSPEVTVEEDLGGRFVGNVFDQIRQTGTAAVDTSEAGERTPLEADAVAYGNEIAGATFEALDPSTLSVPDSLMPESMPTVEEVADDVTGDNGNGGLLLTGAALALGIGAAVIGRE